MKTNLNEVKRMQKIAGVLNEFSIEENSGEILHQDADLAFGQLGELDKKLDSILTEVIKKWKEEEYKDEHIKNLLIYKVQSIVREIVDDI